jgi:hypothetical protein
MRMLANQLRGRQDAGDFLSLSTIPQASALGKSWQQTAANQATQAANQRTGGLNRARQAELDAENLRFKNLQEQRAAAQESRASETQNFNAYGPVEWVRLPDGTMAQQRLNKRTNQMELVGGSPEGATPYEKSSSRGSGNVWTQGGTDPDTGEPIYFNNLIGRPYTLSEIRALGLDPNNLNSGSTGSTGEQSRSVEERKGAIEREKQAAKSFIENQEAYKERAANFNNTLHNLNMMDQGLKNGAWTGPLADMAPTYRESTSMYESGAAGLGLAELQKHSLTPVSDRDLQLVLKSSNPNLYSENQQRWVSWMKESVTRLQKIQQAIDAANRNANLDVTRLPDSDKRLQALNAQIDEIRGDHNFDFELELKKGGEKGGNAAKPPQWTPEKEARRQELLNKAQQGN